MLFLLWMMFSIMANASKDASSQNVGTLLVNKQKLRQTLQVHFTFLLIKASSITILMYSVTNIVYFAQ